MACCIVAAYLYALMLAKVRQWAVFVGVRRPQAGDDRETIWTRVALAFRRQRTDDAPPVAAAVSRR